MTQVLVDTSVWVQHFRRTDPTLVILLQADQVLTHPMVVAELACGTPPEPRSQVLSSLDLLQQPVQATLAETRVFIEEQRLFGLGCGLVDLALLASVLLTPGALLWTLDKRLAGLASRFGVDFQRATH